MAATGRAEAVLTNAQAELARADKLVESGAISKEEYDTKVATLRTATADLAARKAGQDAMADASDAHEARIARFFERLSVGSATTSRGWLKTVPG